MNTITNIELSKLKTVANYARSQRPAVSVNTVYTWIAKGKVKLLTIDGVKFIQP